MHDVGQLDPGELEAYFDVDAFAFGQRMPAGFRQLVEREMTPERVLVSRDEGDLVGAAASERTVMTLPGLERAPAAKVVGVAVIPSHRRQGRLRSLMRVQLDDFRDRGEALATLFASEGAIYGRFGYGMGTFGADYLLDRRVVRLRSLAPSGARVRLVNRDAAVEAFRSVYAAYAPTRAGEIDRNDIDFAGALGIPGDDDARGRFYAVCEHAGRIDGYVAYVVAPLTAPDNHPRAVTVEELCALDTRAYTALWEFLLGIDLVAEVRVGGRPVDEPIRWVLEDARHLQTTAFGDRTWIRLVDVGQALGMRRYPAKGCLVLEVHDDFCPRNAGRWRVQVDEEWGEPHIESVPAPFVAPTPRTSLVELDVSVLASLYLGGVPASQLAAAGRIVGTRESVAVADRLFANDRPPYSLTAF